MNAPEIMPGEVDCLQCGNPCLAQPVVVLNWLVQKPEATIYFCSQQCIREWMKAE